MNGIYKGSTFQSISKTMPHIVNRVTHCDANLNEECITHQKAIKMCGDLCVCISQLSSQYNQ